MTDFRLRVLSGPKQHEPYDLSKAGVFFESQGPDNYLCGTCGAVLFKHITKDQVQNLSVGCGACGSINAVDIK
jgi:hypothetical protein